MGYTKPPLTFRQGLAEGSLVVGILTKEHWSARIQWAGAADVAHAWGRLLVHVLDSNGLHDRFVEYAGVSQYLAFCRCEWIIFDSGTEFHSDEICLRALGAL